MVCTLFEVYFFRIVYGPFGFGFRVVALVCVLVLGPNICLALAIFAFYYGVINVFFYTGFEGGVIMIGFT